ncbi:hypothetical protein ABMB67_000815 [Halalkalibacter oceani]
MFSMTVALSELLLISLLTIVVKMVFRLLSKPSCK